MSTKRKRDRLRKDARIYFRKKRLKNLHALAEKYWFGNFSMMVNDALNKVYDLDPETGEERGGSVVAEPKLPPWPREPHINPEKKMK